MIIIIGGVSGSGKTTLGMRLAAELGWQFFDADDFHPAENVAKMAAETPLTDADRAPWLAALRAELLAIIARGGCAVLACSALKAAYRAQLAVNAAVKFVFLHGDPALIARRMELRRGHFMGAAMLQSQLDALELPDDALMLNIALSPELQIAAIRAALDI